MIILYVWKAKLMPLMSVSKMYLLLSILTHLNQRTLAVVVKWMLYQRFNPAVAGAWELGCRRSFLKDAYRVLQMEFSAGQIVGFISTNVPSSYCSVQ